MTLSTELTRFLSDHATPESRTAFAKEVREPLTMARLAAAMAAKGYQVSEQELGAILDDDRQRALADHQLEAVVGGQDTKIDASTATADAAKLQAIDNNLSTTMDIVVRVLDA